MARKSNKTNNANRMTRGERSVNPLYRTVQRRTTPKLNFDGLYLNFTQYFANITTLANQASAIYTVDASSTNSVSTPSNTVQCPVTGYTGVTSVYNEYVYEKLAFHWQPFIGPGQAGAGSKLYISYFDNAEDMATLAAANTATVVAAAQGARNCVSWNAWEKFTFNVPLTKRRKSFDVNTTIATSADSYDRCMQGVVAFGINGVNAIEALGQMRITGVIKLIGLQTGITT